MAQASRATKSKLLRTRNSPTRRCFLPVQIICSVYQGCTFRDTTRLEALRLVGRSKVQDPWIRKNAAAAMSFIGLHYLSFTSCKIDLLPAPTSKDLKLKNKLKKRKKKTRVKKHKLQHIYIHTYTHTQIYIKD